MHKPPDPCLPRSSCDLAGRFHVHRVKRIASMLNVETDRVDDAVGTGNGGGHGASVMGVGGDLFDAIVLGLPRMPRDQAHPGAGLAQMAHDATADKAGPAKHGCAAYSPIRRMILCDALDCPVKRGTHCFGRLFRGATSVDMMRNHFDQDLRGW